MILLQLACSGMNKAVEMTDMSWSLWCGDISAAFLQGQPEPRAEPLFMRSPRDAIQQAAKSFPCELYEIVGNLYGFASAPRTWWLNVLTTCLQKNFIQHRYDKCLLIKRDAKGLLQVVMIVHVDDFLVTFRSDYDVEELRQMFTWGSTTLLDEKNEIIFRGKEIRMVKTNGKITLKVTQRAFIEEMSCGTLARGRLSAESLNESEWRELRSVAGSLQWLGGQTRPDLCSAVSLANKGRDTKPSDLKTLFEYIQLAKETADLGLAFFPSPFNKASLIIGYGDSSWANGQTPLVAKAKWAAWFSLVLQSLWSRRAP